MNAVSASERTGAEILLEALLREGVDTIFGYPGGANLPIYQHLPSFPRLKHVLVRHEQGAAHMADGYSRASGRPGVCFATSGPGALNLTTGLATAFMDSVPMIAITGQVPTAMVGRDAFQESDVIGVSMPVTKHSYLLTQVAEIAPVVREAFHVARTGRDIGVIGVVTPESQQAVEATHNGRVGLLATPVTVASGAYERAVAAADPNVQLISVPCRDLAPIIQNGFPFDEHVVDTVRAYVAPLREAQVDTVILGCTHYPLVRPMLQRMLGRDVTLVSSGAAIARRVEHALAVAGLESPNRGEGDYRFMCTADVESFRTLGTRFLQMPLGQVVHVELAAEVTG